MDHREVCGCGYSSPMSVAHHNHVARSRSTVETPLSLIVMAREVTEAIRLDATHGMCVDWSALSNGLASAWLHAAMRMPVQ